MNLLGSLKFDLEYNKSGLNIFIVFFFVLEDYIDVEYFWVMNGFDDIGDVFDVDNLFDFENIFSLKI